MTWDVPPQPPAGAGPYYEFPPGPGYPFAGGPSTPLLTAAPSGGAGWGAAPQSAPLPLREAIKQLPRQYRKVLTRPGPTTFAEEMGKAEWRIVWVQLLGYAAVDAILAILIWLVLVAFEWFLFSAILSSSPDTSSFPLAPFILLPGFVIGIVFFLTIFIAAIGGFFFNQGVIYVLAKAFGGQGNFLTQVYTALLFQAPIGLLSGLIGLIPYLGSMIASAGSIYGLVLQIFALMSVHRLSGGKAAAVVLIPVAVGILLAFGFYILFLVFLFNAHNIFVPSQ